MRTNNPPPALPRRGVRNSKEYQFPSWEGIKVWVILLLFFIALGQSHSSFSQETEYRVIPSISEWIEEINNWPEKEYRQEYLIINIDLEKDKHLFTYDREELDSAPDSTVERTEINKLVQVSHFHFKVDFDSEGNYEGDYYAGINLKNLHFKDDFRIYHNGYGRVGYRNCIFDKIVQIRRTETTWWFRFYYCEFRGLVNINNTFANTPFQFRSSVFLENVFLNSETTSPSFTARDCHFKKSVFLSGSAASALSRIKVIDTKIENGLSVSHSRISNSFEMVNTELRFFELVNSDLPLHNTYIPFNQISGRLVLDLIGFENPFYYYGAGEYQEVPMKNFMVVDSLNDEEYQRIISSYSKLLTIYQNRSDYDSYNQCYVEMKNLITDRLESRFRADPNFRSFFDYQINVFLREFSDYGTRPAKALVVSIYVILLFAAVYLFFPNHWDSHGKERIKHRFAFFYKYLSKNKGIHDVYLEENNEEIQKNDDFRKLLESHKDEAPRIFYLAAMPLYRWSVAGTRLYSALLRRVDFLKGRWKETDPKIRPLRTFLIVVMFGIAITYDLFIKVLNAVMLSINTFTTLGFGEIPIKGLPRYLAIIQGFIGWFMLTIFSVSLISQLLN